MGICADLIYNKAFYKYKVELSLLQPEQVRDHGDCPPAMASFREPLSLLPVYHIYCPHFVGPSTRTLAPLSLEGQQYCHSVPPVQHRHIRLALEADYHALPNLLLHRETDKMATEVGDIK